MKINVHQFSLTIHFNIIKIGKVFFFYSYIFIEWLMKIFEHFFNTILVNHFLFLMKFCIICEAIFLYEYYLTKMKSTLKNFFFIF